MHTDAARTALPTGGLRMRNVQWHRIFGMASRWPANGTGDPYVKGRGV
jgi:hypothetical protein